jgi:hypothetical protein
MFEKSRLIRIHTTLVILGQRETETLWLKNAEAAYQLDELEYAQSTTAALDFRCSPGLR